VTAVTGSRASLSASGGIVRRTAVPAVSTAPCGVLVGPGLLERDPLPAVSNSGWLQCAAASVM